MIASSEAWASRLTLVVVSGVGGAFLSQPVRRMAGRPVSWRAMTLAAMILGGVAAFASPPGWAAVVNSALALVLVALAAVDLLSLRLPDAITLPLCAAGLVEAAFVEGGLTDRIIGASAGYLVLAALAAGFRRGSGRSGLGLGDAKLFAAAGAWLGWEVLPQVALIACGFGFAQAGVAVGRRGLGALRAPFAFGPALCAALLITRLWLPTR